MDIRDIVKEFGHHEGVKALSVLLGKEKIRQIQLSGLQQSAAALVFASLTLRHSKAVNVPYLFIMNDEEEAGYFYHDMVQILGDEAVLFFPSSYKRAIKFAQRDPGNEILRTEVLSRVSATADGVGQLFIVTHPQALAELVVTKNVLSAQTLQLSRGEKVDIMFVQETLVEFGFKRVDYVYEPGQFAVRGSIIDVYSYSCELPYRIDFFGDEVDSLRTFEVQTQLSRERKDTISIVSSTQDAQGDANRCSFLDFLPSNTMLVMKDLTFVCENVSLAWEEGFSKQALVEHEATSEMDEQEQHQQLKRELALVLPSAFQSRILDFRRIEIRNAPITNNEDVTTISSPRAKRDIRVETECLYDSLRGAIPIATEGKGREGVGCIPFHTHPQPIFHKNFDLLFQSVIDYQQKGYQLFILADSQKQIDRLNAIFEEKGAQAGTFMGLKGVNKTIHGGFTDDDLNVCFFTDHQIFDRYHKYNLRSEHTRNGKVALTLKELQQFEIGDFVVHVDHGVGRFGGLVRIPNGDRMQEVIKIIYNHDDTVFVSIHSLHKVSKYKGKDGEPPRISTLGTGAWEKMKERTKTKIKDIARDLIKLYSKRREEKGFAFSPDSFMQHELEASFLYEDTPDQLKATQDVKADMEKARPMDRLVCGDVGFGKTEVAVRAAFKACVDNKQVAVLVPTTVLAYQHFRTFSDRLRDLPVKVEYLSRARTAAQTKEILQGLADGSVNIVVGTHKLISKTVKFKDLGLLIIDEEQKFGVSTKEKLRQMKTNVDTLTLTATPIPRTLQFSLMGARDLSVIQTPPPNRYPIQTQLTTFSPEVISEAIEFEMSRNGQVFIVNNRISNLPELEAMIHKYVPDARVCVGHGQMPPEQLEKIMLDFANYDYDVLISTTIIESGLDISNANTIIINGAQNFGLSDLHQMRGRVGRSNKKAFCYLLAPPMSALTMDARRRLQAIENFSDLGSGIHIAMQDLDIRGAGNMLGAEQSGFIADLGYETYQKILSQAVKELRNDEFQELYEQEVKAGNIVEGTDFVDECLLESDLPMSFSEEYVPTSSERMLLYRELDGLEREEDVQAFRKRMTDRFGTIPPEGEELIRVVTLRRLGRYFGCERIILKSSRMRLQFVTNANSPFYASEAFGKVISFMAANAHRCRLEEKNSKRYLAVTDIETVQDACQLLEQMQKVTA